MRLEDASPVAVAQRQGEEGSVFRRDGAFTLEAMIGDFTALPEQSGARHETRGHRIVITARAFVLRLPIGVVGAISPFNFPLNLVAHKVAPAIAAGCPVVLKPASSTPLTALALAGLLLDECGLPPGWLQVVTAPGRVANTMVEHDDIAMITFTGSPPGCATPADGAGLGGGSFPGDEPMVVLHTPNSVCEEAVWVHHLGNRR